MDRSTDEKLASLISEPELNLLKLHIDHLTKNGPIHQRTLFAEAKPCLEVQDFSAFCGIFGACIKTGRLPGYKFARGGLVAKDDFYEEELAEVILNAKDNLLKIAGKEYKTELSQKQIKALLLNVLEAVHDDNGSIEFLGMKYKCLSDDLLKKFLRVWFGIEI
jgi:hypothetical protein